MRSASLLIISIVCFFGFSKITYSQQKEISISGFVYDNITGETLNGTNILVYKDSLTKNSETHYSTSANNFGFYILPKLVPAKYYTIFSHIGYKALIKEISFKCL